MSGDDLEKLKAECVSDTVLFKSATQLIKKLLITSVCLTRLTALESALFIRR